jgi:hypothetical protein
MSASPDSRLPLARRVKPDLELEMEVEMTSAATTPGNEPSQRKRESDDLDLELPRRGIENENEEGFDPGDDSDLGLQDSDENIGLDTATGFEDAGDDLDLQSEENEDAHWSGEVEEVEELPGTDSDLFPGDEYGWLGDDEANDDDESFDEIEPDEAEARDDGGAEGLEDDTELDDMELSELPDIDADAEMEDSVNSESIEEFAGLALIDEPSLEIAVGEVWKMLPARAARVTTVMSLSAPVSALVAWGGQALLCTDALYLLRDRASAPEVLPLTAAPPSALALTEHEGTLYLAAVSQGRLYQSSDGGQSFHVLPLDVSVSAVGFTRGPAGPRLWWQTGRGALCAVSGQANWSAQLDGEVVAFHADGKRTLAALVRKASGRLWLASSSDAGHSFETQLAPPLAAEPTRRIEACRAAVLLCDSATALCARPPESFEPIGTFVRAPAALSDEEDEAYVYALVQRAEEWLVVRRATAASASAPLVLCSLAADLVDDPTRLAVSYFEGGALCVYLATRSALLRVDVSIDGEEPG